MNREIRFRVWDEDKKAWVKHLTMCVDLIMPKSWHKITQFTGLKDKNGKDIYEGDIVRRIAEMRNYSEADGTDESIHEVVYSGIELLPFSETGTDMTEYEVIGNIYENPELLTQPISNKQK